MSTLISPSCAQCGSILILIAVVTEKLEGSLFPQTTTTYRCTNDECQERRDKEMEKRIKLREEKVLSDQRRAQDRLLKKQREIHQKIHY